MQLSSFKSILLQSPWALLPVTDLEKQELVQATRLAQYTMILSIHIWFEKPFSRLYSYLKSESPLSLAPV